MEQAGGKDRGMPGFDLDEERSIQRANQIFLRLREDLHDQEKQMTDRDVRQAAQAARWLRPSFERYLSDWDQAYEDVLSEANLTEEDKADLWRGIEKAGGFSQLARYGLQRLEEAAPEEDKDPSTQVTPQDLLCALVGGILAGGVMTGNSFYLAFGVGIARKANCW